MAKLRLRTLKINNNASIKSIKDTWLDTTSDNPYNEFLLTVMSGMAKLERYLISQRTKEDLESAKARGAEMYLFFISKIFIN